MFSRKHPSRNEEPQGATPVSTISTPRNQRICLNMIAKDESEVIKETIRSLEHEIAGYIVCDTGSTDGTQDIVREEFRRMRVKGYVRQHTWMNFSHNRNLCLEDGLELMGKDCDFWLVLDADQVLVNKGVRLWQYDLASDAYLFKEISRGLHFQHIRMFKANGHWHYRGAIHEQLFTKEGLSYQAKFSAFPEDVYTLHEGTGKRSLEDDLRVMEIELKRSPESAKWHFHLAKAHRGISGNEPNAIYHYGQVLLAGEEAASEVKYLSYVHVAELLLKLYVDDRISDKIRNMAIELNFISRPSIDIEGIIAILDEARRHLQYRYEAWCLTASLHWQQLNDAEKCYEYSHQGIQVGRLGSVTQQTLLASEMPMFCLHVWRCICGFHSQQYAESLESCTKVDKDLPRNNIMETWELEYRGAVQEYMAKFHAYSFKMN